MKIGSVKEIKNNEFRVGLTPDNVHAYVAAGHQVLIEKGAGEGSGFSDEEYKAAGAALIADAAEVWNILEMNRNGEKPESLRTEPEPYVPEFVTAVGDDSISRFDAPKRKRSRGGKNRGRGGRNRGGKDGGQKGPKASE